MAKPKKIGKKKKDEGNTKSEISTTLKKKRALKKLDISLGEQETTQGTTLDTLYILDDSNNKITLAVNVGGQGQTSDMTIKLDDIVVTENLSGDFAEKDLGFENVLKGKKLSIVATITDTSRETNFTSLTIHLKGGFSPADFPLSKAVEEEGLSVDYLCLIEFFKP